MKKIKKSNLKIPKKGNIFFSTDMYKNIMIITDDGRFIWKDKEIKDIKNIYKKVYDFFTTIRLL